MKRHLTPKKQKKQTRTPQKKHKKTKTPKRKSKSKTPRKSLVKGAMHLNWDDESTNGKHYYDDRKKSNNATYTKRDTSESDIKQYKELDKNLRTKRGR